MCGHNWGTESLSLLCLLHLSVSGTLQMEVRIDFEDEMKRWGQGAALLKTVKEIDDSWPKDDSDGDGDGGEAVRRELVPAGR